MAKITKIGYGQVEPNHLSAQRTGQIYAQLPADSSIDKLENGQFVKYDYASGKVNFTGEGEYMLVLNEVKLYDERKTNKDFVMKKEDCVGGVMVPRVFKTNVGDIYTTNMVDPQVEITAGTTKLTPGDKGILKAATGTEDMIWKVVKVYTMADGQAAVKLQRIK